MAGALGHKILAVVDKKAKLPGWPIQMRGRQVSFAQRRTCDRQRIDRIGFAVGPGRVTGMGHQFRRDPHDPLAGRQQIRLQAPG
jgi:hypothetical protein